jgi:NADPH-dependent glutamate synthase beta subunit-like oxidoreductase
MRAQRRVDLMAKEGVRFVTGAHVGKNVDVKAINASSDALMLAAGATKPRDLPIEGARRVGRRTDRQSCACPGPAPRLGVKT